MEAESLSTWVAPSDPRKFLHVGCNPFKQQSSLLSCGECGILGGQLDSMGSTVMRAVHQVGTWCAQVPRRVLCPSPNLCWDVLYSLWHQYRRMFADGGLEFWISLDEYGFLGGVVFRHRHWRHLL